jgi:LDH2 family malate/lactate/ureidoglycolate dehydrogenase
MQLCRYHRAVATITVSAERERALIWSVLAALGVPGRDAVLQAEFLVEADLRGHLSHGIQRLPVIVGRLRAGLAVARAAPKIRWTASSFCEVDGAGGLGPVVGMRALEAAEGRARETGIAAAAVRDANHLGILAPYVEAAARRGVIAIALTTSEALVHPWGGARAVLGTNPIAVGIPADPNPFVLDMATGAISMGKVLAYRDAGRPLEPGWAVDAQGRPTTDAALAADGAISPFGGPKGYGLGLAFELLVSILSSTPLGEEIRGTLDVQWPSTKGDLFICLGLGALGLHDAAGRATMFLDALRNAPSSPGSAVAIPGDRARATREQRLRDGIELSMAAWERVVAIRDELANESMA